MQRLSVLVVFFISFSFFTQAQIPSNCFEIESILVDGCDGSNEGKNEMVIFQNGPAILNVNDLRVDGAGSNGVIQNGKWPNTSNDFLGFCTDATASSNLAVLNQGITQCGFLKEPVGGIIPPGARVLIMTSTDYTPLPTYFENLSDTMYVIFQCAGNTGGHFSNFGTTSERTLVLTNTVSNCADTVVYDRSLLELEDGTPGAQDGGSVGFDWTGNADYFNNGCQAPLVPSSVDFSSQNAVCQGDTIQIIANISGTYSTLTWSGGQGTIINGGNDTIQYIPSGSEAGLITLNLLALDQCGNTKIDENVSFSVTIVVPLTISASIPNPVCIGDTVVLNALGGTNYEWSSGEFGDSLEVLATGDLSYSVSSLVNGCQSVGTYFLTTATCLEDTVDVMLEFPNVFTPNGDDSNDDFMPLVLTGVEVKQFCIYNRWGEIMYQTTDEIIVWDGKVSGKEASVGAYFYTIDYTTITGAELTKHGYLHLVR